MEGSATRDNDEMRELLDIQYHNVIRIAQTPKPMYVSISLCPGAARGAWKHAPI